MYVLLSIEILKIIIIWSIFINNKVLEYFFCICTIEICFLYY